MTTNLDPLVADVVADVLAKSHEFEADYDKWRQAQAMQAHRVLGELMQRIASSTRMWRWSIRADMTHSIEATLDAGVFGHDARAKIMLIAEQFALDYSERPAINGKNIVAASGVYVDATGVSSGVPVKIYELVEPCDCGNCGATR